MKIGRKLRNIWIVIKNKSQCEMSKNLQNILTICYRTANSHSLFLQRFVNLFGALMHCVSFLSLFFQIIIILPKITINPRLWDLARSLARSLTHSLPHSLTHSLPHSLPPSLPPSLPHSLTHSLTHSPTHSQNHLPQQFYPWPIRVVGYCRALRRLSIFLYICPSIQHSLPLHIPQYFMDPIHIWLSY